MKIAFVTGIAAILTLANSPILAQSQPGTAEDDDPDGRVDVTGTRIKRVDPLDYAEFTIVTQDEIEMSGVSNIEQLLTQLPVFSLGGIKTYHPEGNGVVNVELRNLGAERTLVLLDGKRIIGAGGSVFDLSLIPVSAIDRVEVFHGGGSAIVGADAVAGVVNIILKEGFDGFEVNLRSGISTRGDGEQLGASTTMGVSGDKGDLMVTFDWSHRSPVFQIDRGWANPPCEWVYFEEDQIQSQCGSTTWPGGTVTYIGTTDPHFWLEFPTNFFFVGPDAEFYQMEMVYEDWLEGDSGAPYGMYNWGEEMVLSGQSDRFHLVTNGHYELNRHVTAYMQGLFAYQKHGGRYAGEPVRASTNNLYPSPLMIHFSNPFIPDDFFDLINSYGMDYNFPYLDLNKRTNDIGARVFDTTSSAFRAVVGLKGEITRDYQWDIFLNYSRYLAIDVTRNAPDMQRFHTATDPELCMVTPGCVLANLFGEGTMQEEVREFIGFDSTETSQWDLINTGMHFVMEPFRLQGGRFGAVIGGDLRWVRGMSAPDSKVADGLSGTAAGQELSGSFSSQDAFVELSAPFLGDLPGADLLTLDLAGRVSHFETFGNEFTYRAGLVYGPIEDIRLRGSYSTSFREPSILDLYGGHYLSYPAVSDPCSDWGSLPDTPENAYVIEQCGGEGIPPGYLQYTTAIRARNGSNPDLNPETSRRINLGAVFSPTFLPKELPVTVTFDWYNIGVFGGFRGLYAQDILRNCYTVESLEEYCQYITRNSSTGAIIEIDQTFRNVTEITSSGFDFSAHIGYPIFRAIRGSLGFYGNVVQKYEEKDPDDIAAGQEENAVNDFLGEISPMGTGYPKSRFLWTVSIGDPIWQLDNRVRYIAGMQVRDATEDMPYRNMPDVTYWDISGRIRIIDLDFIIGVNNVLDKTPPYFPGTGYNANVQVYDVIGRYIFAKLGYQFN